MRRFHIPLGVKIFALIWLVVWLLPPLHELFSAYTFISGQGPAAADTTALVRRFPNDPRVLASQVGEHYFDDADGSSQTRRIKRQLSEYDALIRRFPRENWLRARRLIFVTGASIDMDYEGAPRRQKRVVTPEILQSSLLVALDGQKIEPDNAFYPWMEAIFRFGLAQNEAGVAALHKAARKTQWQDYVQEGVRQRLALLALDHPLLFEEKLSIHSSILLLHYGGMDKARQAGLQQALEAQKRGDSRREMEVADAVLGAITVLRDHIDTHIGLLNGESRFRKTLEKLNQSHGFKTKFETDMSWQQRHDYSIELARNFAKIARRSGREDVAQRVLAQAQRPLSPLLGNQSHREFWDEFGLEAPWGRVAFQGTWFCVQMATLAKIFALFWLTSHVFSFFWNRKHARETVAIPTRGQIARSANFSVWAMLGYGALAAYFGVGFLFGSVGWVQSLDMATNEQINALLTGAPLYVALFTWIVPITLALWTRNHVWKRPLPQPKAPRSLSRRAILARRGLWLSTLIFSALAWSNGHGLWDDTVFQSPRPLFIASVCLVAALLLEFRLGLPFAGPQFGHLEQHKQSHPWLFAAQLARSSAGVLAVAWSLFFLAGALGMWPLRAELNRSMERRIAMGEIAWMEEQIAARK
ncbi:MAG TPA: hypothetical protein VF627_16085 [Abditibacterium sp.]|jgi:hypothetical protein